MPLQDMPHTFSSMQAWQIMKPHRQLQQKGTVWLQQQQTQGLFCRRVARLRVGVAVSLIDSRSRGEALLF